MGSSTTVTNQASDKIKIKKAKAPPSTKPVEKKPEEPKDKNPAQDEWNDVLDPREVKEAKRQEKIQEKKKMKQKLKKERKRSNNSSSSKATKARATEKEPTQQNFDEGTSRETITNANISKHRNRTDSQKTTNSTTSSNETKNSNETKLISTSVINRENPWLAKQQQPQQQQQNQQQTQQPIPVNDLLSSSNEGKNSSIFINSANKIEEKSDVMSSYLPSEHSSGHAADISSTAYGRGVSDDEDLTPQDDDCHSRSNIDDDAINLKLNNEKLLADTVNRNQAVSPPQQDADGILMPIMKKNPKKRPKFTKTIQPDLFTYRPPKKEYIFYNYGAAQKENNNNNHEVKRKTNVGTTQPLSNPSGYSYGPLQKF